MDRGSRLTPYFARQAVGAVRIGDALARHVGRLLDLLDADQHRARVSEVLDALFPFAELDSQNASLSRVVRSFNEAASEQGQSVRVKISTGRKGGATRRFVWFEGPPPGPKMARLSELESVAPGALQSSLAVEGLPTVVVITYNEHETAAVVARFASGVTTSERRGTQSYTHLGVHAGRRLVHLVSPQGVAESQTSTSNAIAAWGPEAVIAVGIAFGSDASKQKIGDVLVARAVHGYELVRRSKGGEIQLRDSARPATRWLVQRAETCDHTHHSCRDLWWPTIHTGVMLSGSTLVDDVDYRDQLIAMVPQHVIGGEMEAIGLSHPADDSRTAWIVVKGVCDFADGNKHSNKEANQKLAADNAALVVSDMLAEPPESGDNRDVDPSSSDDAGESGSLPRYSAGAELNRLTAKGLLISGVQAATASMSKGSVAPSPGVDLAIGRPVDAVAEIQAWLRDAGAPPVMALIGEYGMGKTVTSQKVAADLDAGRSGDATLPVPLYFDLRSVTGLDRRVPTLEETVVECMNREWPPAPEPDAYSWQNFCTWVSHPALVIFDGLDEVLVKLNAADGHAFTRSLLSVLDAETRPGLKVLITCRSQYFPTLEQQWNHFTGQERGNTREQLFRALTLLPLTRDQVMSYLRAAISDSEPERVMDLIAEVHNLRELSTRPFTLRFIAEQIAELEHLRQRGRPVYGVTLYRLMVQRWLERDSGKHVIKPEHKLLLAESIAAFLAARRSGALPHHELEGFLHQWLAGTPSLAGRYQRLHPDQLEEDLRAATFLSRHDTSEGSTFRFAHTSLAEYFLACYLYRALSEDEPHRWDLPVPSVETLDFLGQLLRESPIAGQLQRMAAWGRVRGAGRNELLLAYTLRAHRSQARHDWPAPTLTGLNLSGADLRDLIIEGTPGSPFPLSEVNLHDALLDRTEVRYADLRGARILNTRLTDAVFSDTALADAVWQPQPAPTCVLARCTGTAHQATLHHRVIAADGPRHRPGMRLSWQSRLGVVEAMGFSPDGSLLATVGDDGGVRLWDTATGDLLRVLEGRAGSVRAVGFSPDGSLLATVGDDGGVRLWDTATGDLLRVLEGHAGSVRAVGFSPDGSLLATGGDDGGVRLWDTATGDLLRVLEGYAGSVRAVGFSPDGSLLATAGDDGGVRLWDTPTGVLLWALEGRAGLVRAVGFSPDGSLLAAGVGGRVRLWDTATGDLLRVLGPRAGLVLAVGFSPDGSLLAGGVGGGVRLWDTATGDLLRVLGPRAGLVRAVGFSPDGSLLATGGDDRGVRLWDTATGDLLRVLEGRAGSVRAVGFSPDGSLLATAGDDRGVRLWDTATGDLLRVLEGRAGSVHAVGFSPDGSLLATAGDDRGVRLWDTATGDLLWALGARAGSVLAVGFSPDGSLLATAGDDRGVRLWDTATGDLLRTLEVRAGSVHAVGFSPDGSLLATAGDDRGVRLWDTATGDLLRTLEGHAGLVLAVGFSPDGSLLATAGGDGGGVRLWDTATGDLLRTLEGHAGLVLAVGFSPDGSLLAAGGDDGGVRLWDTATGDHLRVLKGHAGSVQAVALNADSTLIATAGADGTVRMIDANDFATGWVIGMVRDARGHAVWTADGTVLRHAVGDAWRCLKWLAFEGTDLREGTPVACRAG